MKKLLFLLFIPLFSISQTLTINKGKRLDVNDSIVFKLEGIYLLNITIDKEVNKVKIVIER